MTVQRFTAVCPDATADVIAAIGVLADPPFPLNVHPAAGSSDILVARLRGHAAAMSDGTQIDEAVLRQCPDLRLIVFLGTGADFYIDRAACERFGVRLVTIAHYGDRTIAEHTLALLLAVYRDLGAQHVAMRTGGWLSRPIGELKGKTLGVIGLGGVGSEFARLAAALGMTVLGWSRSPQPDAPCAPVALDALLAQADIVSLHLALTPATERFLDGNRLRRMKRGAVLINTARAGLVDEAELIALLADGHLAGAGLDVYGAEPPAPDAAIRAAANVVLSCHSAWQSPEAVQTLVGRAYDCIAAWAADHVENAER